MVLLITFTLKPKPPYRLDLAVWTLRRRPENIIDDWDGDVYRRVLVVADQAIMVEVRQLGRRETPRLYVTAHTDHPFPGLQKQLTTTLTRLLGIDIGLTGFYQLAANHPQLQKLAKPFVGMKPPRYASLFECLCNAIACQQVSLASGIQLLNRFAEHYGRSFDTSPYRRFAFPDAATLDTVEVEDLRQIGFSRQKATALLNLAAVARSGKLEYTQFEELSDEDCVAALCQFRGIGRWSAEYAMLRGLGRLHVFPGDDVGGRNNLQAWLDLTETLDYDGVANLLQRWQRFGGLIYFHLLLNKLAAKPPGGFDVETKTDD
ncbi:DNA-3-methyladenine glycosylase II [Rhodopirellula maiorica SM1]|uniref:DNA-3-methyladenine glycosylase II n=1 Tax=Rhodopirellula maiorica SM1 TaxID=1265738 RepID=M5RKJ8_9BACT|nr:DNA-3-methyladenine glycosylase [Rhodopirellula maiorica]EMI19843.1 DNA-3-methyladenine glycosylase II [Rhodopirellula maiorica SM1]